MKPHSNFTILATLGFLALAPPALTAATLQLANPQTNGFFGSSVSQSGDIGLVGAWPLGTFGRGGIFRSVNTATGTVTPDLTLLTPNFTPDDGFGRAVALSDTTAIVSEYTENNTRGVIYLYRNLGSGSGSAPQVATFVASDAADGDSLGSDVSLSASIGVAGASDAAPKGAAYVFRNLDTASGSNIPHNLKLIPNDAALASGFGNAVSLSGTTAVVGGDGAAYVFRDLGGNASGTVSQNAILSSTDATNTTFGGDVSISAGLALVGNSLGNGGSGATYVYRNVNTANFTITQDTRLTVSNGAADDRFGNSVSVAGVTGLVGAPGVSGFRGAAYLFFGLKNAGGNVTPDVTITPSVAAADDSFGHSVSLSSGNFLIGAYRASIGATTNAGKVYSGSVRSITTLDTGSTSETIDGISFDSKGDWIIGDSTDFNSITLTSGDTAAVANGLNNAVYVGKNVGSDHNQLTIEGTLFANQVFIGAPGGNTGNELRIENGVTFVTSRMHLAPGDNQLVLSGNHAPYSALSAYLKLNEDGNFFLRVWNGSAWIDVTTATSNLVTVVYDPGSNFTTVKAFTATPTPTPDPHASPTPAHIVDATRPNLRIRGRKTIETLRKRVVIRGRVSDDSSGVREIEVKGASVAKSKVKNNGRFKVVLRVQRDRGRVVVRLRAIDNAGNRSKVSRFRIVRR